MRVLSLFDGIAGAMLALSNLDLVPDAYFASEIEETAMSVVRRHFPGVVQLGGVELIDRADPRLQNVDLLIGGSPCTNLSIAGDGTGLEGEESKLFFQFLEIRDVIKPRFWLLENVGSMKKAHRELMSQYLGCECMAINSSVLTAQSRKRLYWTNIPQDGPPVPLGICVSDILQSSRPPDKFFLDTPWDITVNDRYAQENFRDRKRMVKIFDIGKGRQGERIYSIYGKSANITKAGGGPGGKTGLYYLGDYSIRNPSKEYIQDNTRRLTPLEAERLQGVRDNYTEKGINADGTEFELSDTERYSALGNGFTTPVIVHLLSPLRGLI
jgi:site-specific DNA-cytosine methylase